jgi:Acetyltransferase (GNAT) family
MIHPDIQAALAKERHNTMLAEAAAARLARQARQTRRERRVPGSPEARWMRGQRRRLGTELLAQLSVRARQEGIHRFTALVAADNVAAAGLLRKVCASRVRRGSNALEYEINLVPSEEQDCGRVL